MPTFRVKKIEDVPVPPHIPDKAHQDDAGLDLYSLCNYVIAAGDRELVRTGIAVEIPQGYAGFILPKSGLAIKHGISVLNTPGLIDSNYRGEVKVILQNFGKETFYILAGTKVAQLVIISTPSFQPVEVEELNTTDRNEGGFGSTGIDVNKLKAYNYED